MTPRPVSSTPMLVGALLSAAIVTGLLVATLQIKRR
jgi:hypothetical protein